MAKSVIKSKKMSAQKSKNTAKMSQYEKLKARPNSQMKTVK